MILNTAVGVSQKITPTHNLDEPFKVFYTGVDSTTNFAEETESKDAALLSSAAKPGSHLKIVEDEHVSAEFSARKRTTRR